MKEALKLINQSIYYSLVGITIVVLIVRCVLITFSLMFANMYKVCDKPINWLIVKRVIVKSKIKG